MQFTLYEWVYIVIDIFGTYVIYRYMKVFFEHQRSSKRVELFSYIIYYIFITGIFLSVNIPIVLLLSNLLAFFFLSFNYESTIKKRILSAVLTYLILIIIELSVSLLTGALNFYLFTENSYYPTYGVIACRIFSFIVALLLNNFKNIRKGESVPTSNWICIVLIPMTSLYMILLLFQAEGLNVTRVLTGIVLLFLINFATFYLYDVITAALSEKMQSLLAIEQNKYYDRQFKLMKDSLQSTRILRHDLKNHMFSIRSLIEKDDKEEAQDYITSIMEEIGSGKDYAASGNTIIDSIINFKFQEAEHNEIKVTVDLNIPEEMEIPSFDLTIILGNLLDNAIKAVLDIKEDRFINIKMKYDKGRLLIQVDNAFCGDIIDENGKILTTKKDKSNHGIGLKNIKRAIQKYDGSMTIDYSGKIFSVSILLFLA
ncbi:MAG: GHKL domain-containing protein [Eubacteriales bacterium]|nr:GHKL domain-containing protein [Eubacteriales bacterium]